MIDPADRLLECALEELVGGKAPPDLRSRISDAALRLGREDVPRRRPGLSFLGGAGIGIAASLLLAVFLGGREGVWKVDGARSEGAWVSTDSAARFEKAGSVSATLSRGRARVLDPARLELASGRLDVSVVPGSGPFSVLTPAGRVSVTGTVFSIWVRPVSTEEGGPAMDKGFWTGTAAGIATAVVTVAVFQGTVRFSGEGEAAVGEGQAIRSGEMVSARPGQPPPAPRRIEDRLAEAEAAQGRIRGSEETLASLRTEASRSQSRVEALKRELGEIEPALEGLRAEAGKAGEARKAEEERQRRVKALLSWPVFCDDLGVRDARQRELLTALMEESVRRASKILAQAGEDEDHPPAREEILKALERSRADTDAQALALLDDGQFKRFQAVLGEARRITTAIVEAGGPMRGNPTARVDSGAGAQYVTLPHN